MCQPWFSLSPLDPNAFFYQPSSAKINLWILRKFNDSPPMARGNTVSWGLSRLPIPKSMITERNYNSPWSTWFRNHVSACSTNKNTFQSMAKSSTPTCQDMGQTPPTKIQVKFNGPFLPGQGPERFTVFPFSRTDSICSRVSHQNGIQPLRSRRQRSLLRRRLLSFLDRIRASNFADDALIDIHWYTKHIMCTYIYICMLIYNYIYILYAYMLMQRYVHT
jgi:hypothetical protein